MLFYILNKMGVAPNEVKQEEWYAQENNFGKNKREADGDLKDSKNIFFFT